MGLDVPLRSSISGQAGLLDFLAQQGVGRVEVPGVCPGVTFLDEQLHCNRSASQGQVGEVDSRGYPTGKRPRGSPGPTLSSVGLEPLSLIHI